MSALSGRARMCQARRACTMIPARPMRPAEAFHGPLQLLGSADRRAYRLRDFSARSTRHGLEVRLLEHPFRIASWIPWHDVHMVVRHVLTGIRSVVLKNVKPRGAKSADKRPSKSRGFDVNGAESAGVHIKHRGQVLHWDDQERAVLVLSQVDKRGDAFIARDELALGRAREVHAERTRIESGDAQAHGCGVSRHLTSAISGVTTSVERCIVSRLLKSAFRTRDFAFSLQTGNDQSITCDDHDDEISIAKSIFNSLLGRTSRLTRAPPSD